MDMFSLLWHLAKVFLEWEMLQIKVVQKINIHIFSWIAFFLENRAVHEIMSLNAVEPEKPQITTWRMRASTRPRPRARTHTHTHTRKHTRSHTEICDTYCFYTATVVSCKRSMLRHMYIACLVLICIYSLGKLCSGRLLLSLLTHV